MSWKQVAMLALYVIGAVVTVTVGQDNEAIAYVFAGAAANQGAISLRNGANGRKKN